MTKEAFCVCGQWRGGQTRLWSLCWVLENVITSQVLRLEHNTIIVLCSYKLSVCTVRTSAMSFKKFRVQSTKSGEHCVWSSSVVTSGVHQSPQCCAGQGRRGPGPCIICDTGCLTPKLECRETQRVPNTGCQREAQRATRVVTFWVCHLKVFKHGPSFE